MYLPLEETAKLLRTLGGLLTSLSSRVWIDHVTPELFKLAIPEVRSFLASMARLGEPFVTGFSDAGQVAPDIWRSSSLHTAAETLDVEDAVYRAYRFSVLEPAREHDCTSRHSLSRVRHHAPERIICTVRNSQETSRL